MQNWAIYEYLFWTVHAVYLIESTMFYIYLEKVLERGEKIDVLVGKTEELDHSVSG